MAFNEQKVKGRKGSLKKIGIFLLALQLILLSFIGEIPQHANAVSPAGPVKIDLSANPTDWTNGDVEITADITSSATNESGLKNIEGKIAAGGTHSLAVKSDGTVWGWGDANFGQLSGSYIHDQSSPVQIKGISDVKAVSAGHVFSTALKTDGTVWAWGYNNNGQLGNGTTEQGNTPTPVKNLTDVIAIDAGRYHTLALKKDGTVWAWGVGGHGRLGDGKGWDQYEPVQASNLTDVIAVSAGDDHSLALKKDGTVWAWGDNLYGALGTGNNLHYFVPVQVPYISNVVAISAGTKFSLALKDDGTVWAWGRSNVRQLGNGETYRTLTPIKTNTLKDVITISAGDTHSMAMTNDASLYSWGNNYEGQIGDRTQTNRLSPVQVANLILETDEPNSNSPQEPEQPKTEGKIILKKWAKGEQSVDYFSKNGTAFEGNSFKVSENAVYTVYARDDAGNEAVASIQVKNIDKIKPEIGLSMNPTEVTSQDVTVTADITDDLSGIEEKRWEVGHRDTSYFKAGGGNVIQGNSFVIEQNGSYSVYARDKAGNETVKTFEIENIDKSPLVIFLAPDPNTWTNKDVTVDIIVNASKEGMIETVKYAKDDRDMAFFQTGGTTLNSLSFNVTNNGVYTAYVKDKGGNEAVQTIEISTIDRIAPTLDLSVAAKPITEGLEVRLKVTEKDSGVNLQKWAKGDQALSYFRNSDNGNHILGTSFFVKEKGIYTVYVTDEAGNEAIKTINIDNVDLDLPPTPTFKATPTEPTDGDVTITIDYVSDGKTKLYRIINEDGTGTWTAYTGPFKVRKNGLVEAKVENTSEVWSEVGRYAVNNIGAKTSGGGDTGNGSNQKKYAFPLQQSMMKNIGIKDNKQRYEWDYVTDLFFMTKYTGFQTSYSYTEDMRKNFTDGTVLPSYNTLMARGRGLTETAFSNLVGETYKDEVLYTDSPGDFDKLQRYYLPISPESQLKPKQTYQNITTVHNVGLNDLTLEFDQSFSFDHFLIGSGSDDAFIIEQVDERETLEEDEISYVHKVQISNEQAEQLVKEEKSRTKERMHRFRFSDRSFADLVKTLIKLGL